MINIENKQVLIGGFHDHWFRNGSYNATLLMAAMNYYHYDFICSMDQSPIDDWLKECLETYCPWMKMYLGHEKAYGWGHVVTLGHQGDAPPSDDRDYFSVMKRLTEQSQLCALAHPNFPMTWETIFLSGDIDRLVDEPCMDAVQLGFSEEELEWFYKRDRAGKLTPIIAGWDHHLFNPVKEISPVLYNTQYPPSINIDSLGSRTIVIADDNSWDAIVKAVKEGNSVIENFKTGELVGAKRALDFLKENGYHSKIEELDKQRDAMQLELDCLPVAGERLELRFAQSGRIFIPGTLEKPIELIADSSESVTIEKLPLFQDFDKSYFSVVQTLESGYSRVWAVELNHPIQLDVLPKIDGDKKGVEFVAKDDLKSKIVFKTDLFSENLNFDKDHSIINVTDRESPDILHYSMNAINAKGISRDFSGVVTFLNAPFFDGDWDKSPVYPVNSEVFSGGYGANRPYPGEDEFSGRLQFAWTNDEFLFRADVNDPIHFQPFIGHMVYQADALQLAIDPMLRRRETLGSVYTFNLALTENGPELFRLISPSEESSESFTAPMRNETMSDKYLAIEKKENGLIYTLKLPWQKLAPVDPKMGQRIGIYFLMKNNNGDGLLDSLKWPFNFQGMWMIPQKWGVLTLI